MSEIAMVIEALGKELQADLCQGHLGITIAVQGGAGPVSGEGGDIYLFDWAERAIYEFRYGGAGLGLSVPGMIVSVEAGRFERLESPYDLEGFGLALSGYAAVGWKGMAGQVATSVGFDYRTASGGWAGGVGASLGGVATYTTFQRRIDFNSENLPKFLEPLISACVAPPGN